MSLHAETRKEHQKTAEHHVKRSGYKAGGEVAADIDRDKKAIGQHEEHLHKGEPKTKLRLRRGGSVHGVEPKERLDKRARGGAMKGKHKPNVAVIIHAGGAGDQEKQQAAQQGLQMGAALGARQAAAQMQPKPPMGGAPGMPPQGMPPGGAPRPPMMNRGGKLGYPNPKAGSGGAAGRMEKSNAYGDGEKVKVKGYVRRRAGGAIS